MSRRRLERRRLAEERWPTLSRFLGCYLHQDFDVLHGSVGGAIAAAIRDASLEMRRTILREWRDWNVTEGTSDDIRSFLQDGFGVAVYFKKPIDARNLMNRVYDEILVSVKAETSHAQDQWGTAEHGD